MPSIHISNMPLRSTPPSMPPKTGSSANSGRSRSTVSSDVSSTPTQNAALRRLEAKERMYEERNAQRECRQYWTATGKPRKEEPRVHPKLRPLQPIVNLKDMPLLAVAPNKPMLPDVKPPLGRQVTRHMVNSVDTYGERAPERTPRKRQVHSYGRPYAIEVGQ